eukprot:jgi/Hompol1/6609/HPOL_000606-RA
MYQQKARKPLGLTKKINRLKTPVDGRGLNGPYKQEVKHQIIEENRAILSRLESQRAHYARMRWEEERRQNLFYLANIANHPIPFIEEIEELGLHKRIQMARTTGDPYRPATAPAEIQQLHAIKQEILDQARREEESLAIPTKWNPKAMLLPRVATLPHRKFVSAGAHPSESHKKTIGPLVPRVALLAMAKTRQPVIEPKEPESIVKKWTPAKAIMIEHKVLFKAFDQPSLKRVPKKMIPKKMIPKIPSEPALASAIQLLEADPAVTVAQIAAPAETTVVMIRKSILSDVEQEQARMHGIQSVQTQHTVEAVISGVPGLAAGYPLPEPVNKTVWIFFSSTTEDTVMERDVFVEKCVPEIAQAYGTSIASPQYQTPFDKFRRALKLPTRLKPLLLVITKLDRLKFEHESEKGFGWLLDDLPGYINIVLSLRDERFPGSHLPQLMSKLLQLSVVAQNELREKKGTIDTSKWTLPVSPEQAVLPIGDFIPTVAKVALKRYIGLDSRRLRPAQEDTIMHAFERASLLDLQRMGTASPLLLRLLYNMSRTWRSYDHVLETLPVSVTKAIEFIFTTLEAKFGRGIVATVCATLALSHDGLLSTELEDMLSLQDSILEQATLWSTTRVTRISPVLFLQLITALNDTGLIMQRLAPNGIPVMFWAEIEFADCARSYYIPTKEAQIEYASLMADYFSGRYCVKKPFAQDIVGHSSLIAEHRGVPEQPTKLTEAALIFGRWAERRAAWNTRKIRELPNAYTKAHRWNDLLDAVYDIEIIEGLRETS